MPQDGLGAWGMIIFMAAIFAMMYFLMIRPRQMQQKALENMTKELRVGDRVIMAGGIYGQIESLGEDTVILRVESGATMKVARSSILVKQEGEKTGKGTF